MSHLPRLLARSTALALTVVFAAGCSKPDSAAPSACAGGRVDPVTGTVSSCNETVPRDAVTKCGGPNGPKCAEGASCATDGECVTSFCPAPAKVCQRAPSDDGVKNGTETDVDCGGAFAPRCSEGSSCLEDTDCSGACSYQKKCVAAPSCKPHLGGDTCGRGEVGEPDAAHESCCRSLPVPGYTDMAHPGKRVYLDKYEITAGRVRAFVEAIAAKYGGKPDVLDWVQKNRPQIWDPAWDRFMPADHDDGRTVRVDSRLLTLPPPYAPPPPSGSMQDRSLGLDYQFGGHLYVYIHAHNCSTHVGSYGFPTFFYPQQVIAKSGPGPYPPRADGHSPDGTVLVPASEALEVKSMNCITNAMLAAFCHWDGGQLATSEVLDYVTGSPPSLGNLPGCGSQVGTENPPTTDSSMVGGRCAPLSKINATYDAGAQLPEPNSPLNAIQYAYPYYADGTDWDKAWQVSAPGRGSWAADGEPIDTVRINPDDEPWMDLAGNLNESVLVTSSGSFTGRFGLKYRGIGYQSARAQVNTSRDWPGEEGLGRIERPEARAGFAGGRCMRFR